MIKFKIFSGNFIDTENMADKQLNEWKKQNRDTQILGWKYAMSNYNHSICISYLDGEDIKELKKECLISMKS